MGFLDKMGQKLDKAVGSMLAGDSKKQWEEAKATKEERKAEAEEAERVQVQEFNAELEAHRTDATVEELKDLEQLLTKIGVLDENKIWIAGLEHYRLDTNPRFANMFKGKKIIRAVAINKDMIYWCRYEDGKFFAYNKHVKQDISYFEIVGHVEKDFRLETKNKKKIWLRVTKNRGQLSAFRRAVK